MILSELVTRLNAEGLPIQERYWAGYPSLGYVAISKDLTIDYFVSPYEEEEEKFYVEIEQHFWDASLPQYYFEGDVSTYKELVTLLIKHSISHSVEPITRRTSLKYRNLSCTFYKKNAQARADADTIDHVILTEKIAHFHHPEDFDMTKTPYEGKSQFIPSLFKATEISKALSYLGVEYEMLDDWPFPNRSFSTAHMLRKRYSKAKNSKQLKHVILIGSEMVCSIIKTT